MYFDLDKIDKNIYFEFSIHGNNIYRFNLDTCISELSLEELCYYLTRDIYKEFNSKKNANPNLKYFSEIACKFIIQTIPVVTEIYFETNEFTEFPLNIHHEQKCFADNLNNSILSAIMKKEDVYSYFKSNEDTVFFAQRKQNNNLWKHFPYFKHRINKTFDKIYTRGLYNLKFKFTNDTLYKVHLKNVITGISYDIDKIESNTNEIRIEFHEILNHVRRYERLYKYSGNNSLNTFLKQHIEALKKDPTLYFNYFHGNFSKIPKDEIINCHKKWAIILLKKLTDQEIIGDNLERYLYEQIDALQNRKEHYIAALYEIQNKAERLSNELL